MAAAVVSVAARAAARCTRWHSVGATLGDSVGAEVGDSVGAEISASVGAEVDNSVGVPTATVNSSAMS